jgi:hypothetical protein
MNIQVRVLLPSLALAMLPSLALAQSGGEGGGAWKLPQDIIVPNENQLPNDNQISFTQGTNGGWYFMESSFPHLHNPLAYRFLHNYTAPCDLTPDFAQIGVACWESADPAPPDFVQHIPAISVNFTDTPKGGINGLLIPARVLVMNPSELKLAVVGWNSPITGDVRVSGSFTNLNQTCGNGVSWSVDKGGVTLASGQIPKFAPPALFDLSEVTVLKGQVLYFVLDSLGDRYCDETALNLTISTVKR